LISDSNLAFLRSTDVDQPIGLASVLDAAEQLDAESQAELVAVLSRRLAERGRARVVSVIEQSRREIAEGKVAAMTPAEIIREAKS